MSLNILVPLSPRRLKNEQGPLMYYTMETYLATLKRQGLSPLFVTPEVSADAVEQLYVMSSGVLIIGGADIDPALYSQAPHHKTNVGSEATDRFVMRLVQKTLADKKPLLGICRGCQMLAVASGGTLHQHVDELTAHPHHPGEGKDYSDISAQQNHPITFVPGSRAHKLFNQTSLNVNSAHHQAIDQVGANLRASAHAADNIIEIIEHTDPNYFCFGIQSHPEIEENGFGQPLFDAFGEAVKKFEN